MPIRVQRKRTRGWKMPKNTVYVGRPTKWGNPWIATSDSIRQECVDQYRYWVTGYNLKKTVLPFDCRELKGKNLACWCRPDQPCHADVLLELANK